MTYPRPLPDDAVRRCQVLAAPPRLVAHLTLVHDTACDLLESVEHAFGSLSLNRRTILLGAATHDLGKVLFPQELNEPGRRHEDHGPRLLKHHGIEPEVARIAWSHANWEHTGLDEVLVALADSLWKGERQRKLEDYAVSLLPEHGELSKWHRFIRFDTVCESIAAAGDERLAWQLSSA